MPVTVLTSEQNLGFSAAVNQGWKAAHGEYLVLLNTDAVVTAGWLDQLIALTRACTAEPSRRPQETQDRRGILTILDFATEVAELHRETCGPARVGVRRPAPSAGPPVSDGYNSPQPQAR